MKPKFQVNDFVTTADLKRTFSTNGKTNWSYKSYKSTENLYVTMPSYRIDNLPERHNETLMKKTIINESK